MKKLTLPLKKPQLLKTALLTSFLFLSHPVLANQTLVTVGDADITERALEFAMESAPFATQFAGMDNKDQARLRGDMLTRLVQSEVLRKEALAQGLDKTKAFKNEVINFRTGLLYERYIQSMRNDIKIPKDIDDKFKESMKGEPDALEAARSAWISRQYAPYKKQRFLELGKKYHLQAWPERIKEDATADTLLLQGDGFKIQFGDLTQPGRKPNLPMIRERLDDLTEVMLAARAAEDAKEDVSAEVKQYQHDLLPRMLVNIKKKEWIPNRETLVDYFQKHPQLGYIPERRNIGQIVLKTEKEANEIRERIVKGESLFTLASKYSIDPYGKDKSGDIGWKYEGSGMPEIEAVLKTLKDDEISPVIKTDKGYQIVTILGRKPSSQKTFGQIYDRVERQLLAEKFPPYFAELYKKYPIKWHISNHEAVGTSKQ